MDDRALIIVFLHDVNAFPTNIKDAQPECIDFLIDKIHYNLILDNISYPLLLWLKLSLLLSK